MICGESGEHRHTLEKAMFTEEQHKKFLKFYDAGMPLNEIARVMNVSPKRLSQYRNSNGIDTRLQDKMRSRETLPAPKGMLEDAKTMTITAMADKYEMPRTLVKAILLSNKVEWIDGNKIRQRLGVYMGAALSHRMERQENVYDYAANHLRRFYRNVHRADIKVYEHSKVTWGDLRDVPSGGKGYYFIDGKGVVTQDEMLSLACNHGFSSGVNDNLAEERIMD